MEEKEKLKIELFDPKSDIASKFDFYIKIVVSILVIAMVTMLIMVAGLVLDAWRFKSNSYDGIIETIRGQEQMLRNYEAERNEMKILLQEIGNKIDKSVGNKK